MPARPTEARKMTPREADRVRKVRHRKHGDPHQEDQLDHEKYNVNIARSWREQPEGGLSQEIQHTDNRGRYEVPRET